MEIECTFPEDLDALRSLLLSSLLSSSSATSAAALPLLRSLICSVVSYGKVWNIRYVVRLSQCHRVIVRKRFLLSMSCHVTPLHDYISRYKAGRQAPLQALAGLHCSQLLVWCLPRRGRAGRSQGPRRTPETPEPQVEGWSGSETSRLTDGIPAQRL